MDAHDQADQHVVIVGGGFAGIGCAKRLADEDGVHVTLVDRNNYHQFQPLLYQVATSLLSPADVSYSIRKLFADSPNVDVKMADITSLDLAGRAAIADDGQRWAGDYLVVGAGSRPNFFRTLGAADHAFPLYSLDDATLLRSRLLSAFEDADCDPTLVDKGALNFVVVGGGPTGVEVAGSLADLINDTMAVEYRDLAVEAAQIHLIDHGQALLAPFSDSAHDYVAKVLQRKGVRLHMGTAVTEVGAGHVKLSDGATISTRCVVWGGGIKAPAIASAPGLPAGRGGRVDVQPDLSIDGAPGVYAIGDMANIAGAHGGLLPQLGSVALQSGTWAAENVLAEIAGRPRKPFHYKDKGIMAMIGRGSAIAEVGSHRHEMHGVFAFAAWLGVHSLLMTGVRNRIDAFVNWGWDYFSDSRGPQVLDRSNAAHIDWDDDAQPSTAAADARHDGVGAPAG